MSYCRIIKIKQTICPALPGDVPPSGWHQAPQSLTCTQFEPADFKTRREIFGKINKAMALDTEILKSNISKYLNHELSKRQLANWSKTEFDKLVNGEIVYLNKIIFYKILSQLIQINDPIDALPKSGVVDILNILEGKKIKTTRLK